MTNGKESVQRPGWMVVVLPWVIAAGALCIYLFTINPWVSVLSLPHVAKAAGWVWQPAAFNPAPGFINYPPAYYLATLPIKWLPQASIPFALNLFSALCATLALGLLARCVMLLPHDRTQDQRDREFHPLAMLTGRLAWLPPLLAVIVCGLQLSFWEHSTNGTPDMLDLLLFAIVIWLLLKFRHDERESRLYWAGFVYGVGIANNYAMLGFFPLFVAALVWIRGFSFFNLHFLSRLALCGLLGLSLYLLMPILSSFSGPDADGIWATLLDTLKKQKEMLFKYALNKGRLLHGMMGNDTDPLWVLAIPSLLPLLFLAFRLPSNFGDTSKVGMLLTRGALHLLHAFLLFFCIWISFDPPLSGRQIFSKYGWQMIFSLLPLQFLSALCIGYFAGYFLLVFKPVNIRGRRTLPIVRMGHTVALVTVVGLTIISLAGLSYKNLPALRLTNGKMMKDFADALAYGLPKNGVLLSDDPTRLQLIQAWLAKQNRSGDYLPIDVSGIKDPDYHRYLQKRFPQKWKPTVDEKRTKALNDNDSVLVLSRLSAENSITYLHPSFGYFFEHFHEETHGISHRLIKAPEDALLQAPMAAQLITENEAFWEKLTAGPLRSLELALNAGKTRPKNPGLIQRLFQRAHVGHDENYQVKVLGMYYSREANYWGVQLQKQNRFEEAAKRFEQAAALNPDNVVAQINLEYNTNFRAGLEESVNLSRSVNEDFFGKYRNWQDVLARNGPYDEPTLTFAQGYVFTLGRNLRQAAQYFDRTRSLATNDVGSRLWLAQLHLMRGLPQKAAYYATEIRALNDRTPLGVTNGASLFGLEVAILFATEEPEKAVEFIEATVGGESTNTMILTHAAQILADKGFYDKAQRVLDKQLKITPNDGVILLNKVMLYNAATNYPEAIATADLLLSGNTNVSFAYLHRGIAELRSDKLDAAQKDFEKYLEYFPRSFEALFGLHDIAFRRNDREAATKHGASYLSNAPPSAIELPLVKKRLEELKGE